MPTTMAKKSVGDISGRITWRDRVTPGAVDPGGFEEVVGHGLQSRGHQDERKAKVLPDRDDGDRQEGRSGSSRTESSSTFGQ